MAWQSGQFIIGQQGQNGATVSAWLTSRFADGTPIAQDTSLPSGTADSGPVTTSVDYGGAGFWSMELEDDDDYAIAIQWDGHIYYLLWTNGGGGGGGGLPGWFQFGSGTPVGTVVPEQKGAVYQDIENGAFYEAVGLTSADWAVVGGNGDNTVPGVTTSADGQVSVLGATDQTAAFTDIGAAAGSGNGLFWNPGSADGDQTLQWQFGAPGSPTTGGIDADGNMTLAGWLTLEASGNALHFVDTDPNTAEPGTMGDVAWRTDLREWYGCSTSGASGDAIWVVLASGGGAPNAGSSFYLPNSVEVILAAISFVSNDFSAFLGGAIPQSPLPSYTYAEPTITGTADGALEVDFYSPVLGDVIAVVNLNGVPEQGFYAVTAVGDGSHPYVLTRVAPFDEAETLGQNLVIGPAVNGGNYQFAVVQWDPAGAYGSDFVLGTTVPLCNVFFTSAESGSGASFVEGHNNVASGKAAHAEGFTNVAFTGGHAEGQETVAGGQDSHAEGNGTWAKATSSHAEGSDSIAYLGLGAHAESGGGIAVPGDSQFQRTTVGIQTTDATPVSVSLTATADFTHTYLVTVRTVARRIDTPGTDSAWISQGVMRGDGVSAYTWVGGTAPVAVLVAQDAGASTWVSQVDIDPVTFAVLVSATGEVAETINWSNTVELDEVAG